MWSACCLSWSVICVDAAAGGGRPRTRWRRRRRRRRGPSARPVVRSPRQTTLASLCRRARRAVVDVVDHGGPDAGDLVGGDGDADARPADADARARPGPRPRPRPRPRPYTRVVDRHLGRVGARGRRPRGRPPPGGRRSPSSGRSPAWSEPTAMRMAPSVPSAAGPSGAHPAGRGPRGAGRLAWPMPLDPSTPVVVGVGQVTNRPHTEGEGSLADRPEPARPDARRRRPRPSRTATARRPAARPRPGRALLARTGSLRVANPLSWHYVDPGALLAEELGIEPAEILVTTTGRQQPAGPGQRHRPGHRPGRARRGRDRRGRLLLHPGGGPPAPRPSPPALDGPAGRHRAARRCSAATGGAPPRSEEERGLDLPIHVFPLFENALRAEAGRTLPEHLRPHRRRCGPGSPRWRPAIPHAWLRERVDGRGPDHRPPRPTGWSPTPTPSS